MGNLKQIQLTWAMYANDNNDSKAGNHWQDQANRVPDRGNWVSGWLEPRQANNRDKTNSTLLLEARYGVLGPYAGSKEVYRCIASRIMVQQGTASYPLIRTISMSTWMGFRTTPWNGGFRTFPKTTSIGAGFSPSDAIVLIDERDDSIDDGMFAIDMVGNVIPNVPAGYHGGSGGLTFADGHGEIHRWRSPEVLRRQQQGKQTEKWEFMNVQASNPDLVWLRAHATVKL